MQGGWWGVCGVRSMLDRMLSGMLDGEFGGRMPEIKSPSSTFRSCRYMTTLARTMRTKIVIQTSIVNGSKTRTIFCHRFADLAFEIKMTLPNHSSQSGESTLTC